MLFCDLVGSTALRRGSIPRICARHGRVSGGAARRSLAGSTGHVAKFLGDGVLVYFGWPRAHEDDAERAVRAGLGLLEAVAGLEARPDAHLAGPRRHSHRPSGGG